MLFVRSLVPAWAITVSILLNIESPLIMKFSCFLELFSLSYSNGVSLSQLLFNSSKFLQLSRTWPLLAGESWCFMLLLICCFARKLMLSFCKTCGSIAESRFFKILRHAPFSSELFPTVLTSRLDPMSRSWIVGILFSIDLTKSFEQVLYYFSVRRRILNCNFVNYLHVFSFPNLRILLIQWVALLMPGW